LVSFLLLKTDILEWIIPQLLVGNSLLVKHRISHKRLGRGQRWILEYTANCNASNKHEFS
jgi:hypothetical protein